MLGHAALVQPLLLCQYRLHCARDFHLLGRLLGLLKEVLKQYSHHLNDGDGQGDNADRALRGPCCVSTGCEWLSSPDCAALGGTWLGEDGDCDNCPTGKWSEERATFCKIVTNCAPGKFVVANATGASDRNCSECAAGEKQTLQN